MVGEVSIATIMSLDADTSGDDSESSTSLGDYLADMNNEDVEQILAPALGRDHQRISGPDCPCAADATT